VSEWKKKYVRDYKIKGELVCVQFEVSVKELSLAAGAIDFDITLFLQCALHFMVQLDYKQEVPYAYKQHHFLYT